MVTQGCGSAEPGQQRYSKRQNNQRNPELQVGQDRFEQIELLRFDGYYLGIQAPE